MAPPQTGAASAPAANGGAANGTASLPVVNRFEIQFDAGDHLIVHGGETLKGNILIELNEKTTLQAVKLQIAGRATWLGDGQAKGEVEKIYFNQDMTLLERPPGRPEVGHFPWVAHFLYTLPFECPIPKGCPTSYESPFGSIRYYVKATLVEEDEGAATRGATKEHYVKAGFMLLAPSDASAFVVEQGEPVQAWDTAAWGSCCCKGKLSAALSLAKSNYTPGDDVIGSIKLNGKKPKAIFDQIEVRLVDRVFHVGTPEKMGASPWRTLVARRLDKTDRPPKADSVDSVYFLTIPAVVPSTKGNFDPESGDLAEMAPNGLASRAPNASVFESPSTSTLRIRRVPFLRVQYAIQVSIANIVIMEAPITVAELPYTGFGTSLRPFVAGAQPIEEPSDTGKVAFGGPFSYTPVYPIRESPEKVPLHSPVTASVAAPSDGQVHKEVAAPPVQHEPSPVPAEIPAPAPETFVSEQRVIITETRREVTPEQPSPIAVEQPKAEEAVEEHQYERAKRSATPVETPSEPEPVAVEETPVYREPTPEPVVQITTHESTPEISTHVTERVEDVVNEDGEVIGTKTTRVTKTETHQVVESSAAGDEAIAALRERLEDGWAKDEGEGDEGVERVEATSSVLHDENGEVIATSTTTTKILRRVKRGGDGEGNEDEEKEEEEKEDHSEVPQSEN